MTRKFSVKSNIHVGHSFQAASWVRVSDTFFCRHQQGIHVFESLKLSLVDSAQEFPAKRSSNIARQVSALRIGFQRVLTNTPALLTGASERARTWAERNSPGSHLALVRMRRRPEVTREVHKIVMCHRKHFARKKKQQQTNKSCRQAGDFKWKLVSAPVRKCTQFLSFLFPNQQLRDWSERDARPPKEWEGGERKYCSFPFYARPRLSLVPVSQLLAVEEKHRVLNFSTGVLFQGHLRVIGCELDWLAGELRVKVPQAVLVFYARREGRDDLASFKLK